MYFQNDLPTYIIEYWFLKCYTQYGQGTALQNVIFKMDFVPIKLSLKKTRLDIHIFIGPAFEIICNLEIVIQICDPFLPFLFQKKTFSSLSFKLSSGAFLSNWLNSN